LTCFSRSTFLLFELLLPFFCFLELLAFFCCCVVCLGVGVCLRVGVSLCVGDLCVGVCLFSLSQCECVCVCVCVCVSVSVSVWRVVIFRVLIVFF
jgi:hypothetical protein